MKIKVTTPRRSSIITTLLVNHKTTMPRSSGIISAITTTHHHDEIRLTRQKTKQRQHQNEPLIYLRHVQRPANITTRDGSMIQNKVMSSTLPPASNVTTGSKPYIVEDRTMISRSSGDRVKITHTLEPGKDETGCLTCFYSPTEYPILAKCPCYDHPEYIVNEMSSSRYIYIRENSIEYNSPTLAPAKSKTHLSTVLCCGNSPTELVVRDRITVLYFDDILFDSVRNDTRPFNPLITFCCGGHGEAVQLESRYCWDMCYRSRGCGICCIPCIPVICPDCVCPCAARKTIYVDDAETAVKIISKAKDDARIRMQVMER